MYTKKQIISYARWLFSPNFSGTTLILVLLIGGLFLTSFHSYLLFHTLAELFTVAVALGIFMLAWNSRRFFDNGFLLFIGISFLFVGLIDLVHALAFPGMPTIKGASTNLGAQLWISARIIQGASLLISPIFLNKKINASFVYAIYSTIAVFLFASIFFWKVFPTTFVEGAGLTNFKNFSEYFVILTAAVAAIFLMVRRKFLDREVLKFMIWALFFTVLSEFFFTLYINAYSFSNLLGHLLKIATFYFIYRATIEIGLEKPYETIFKNLKQSEEGLQKTNDFHQTLLATLPLDIDIVDETGNILFVSPRLEKRFGKKIIGKKCWQIYKDDKKQCENCPLKSGVNLKTIKTIEANGILGDKTFIIHHTGILYKGRLATLEIFDDARRQGIITEGKRAALEIFEDVTDLKKTENDLKKFNLAVDSASDHIIITDEEGVIIYANKAVEDTTGYARKEIIGAKPSLWGKQMAPDFYQTLWKTIKEEKRTFVGEITNKRKNGEKYFAEIKVSPVINKSGQIEFFVGIERDISKFKEIEKAKNEFISLASHQLRTPLTSINLSAEMLARGLAGDLNAEQKKYLRDIRNDIRAMANLIELLLNVSRIELGTFLVNLSLASLPSITNEILKEVAPQIAARKIKLKKIFGKSLPDINIDKNLTKIILQNLISNAVKYNRINGKLNVEIKVQEENAIVAIKDTGYGIPEKQQSQIFSKFFRADNVVKIEGIGLGLYAIKSMIDKCGAKIWFESEQNRGTTFYLAIPLGGMRKISPHG